MRRAIPVGVAVLAVALMPAPASAQADQQVNQLLQQAQQAYEQFLDIGAAQNYVDQAIGVVQSYGVSGNAAALAYALRGVIHLWMGEESDAERMFSSAVANNPNVQVPAAWGGPDVDAALDRARRSAPPPTTTCPVGTVLQPNGTCAAPAPTCPAGMVLQPNGTCAPPAPTCPAGMVLQPNGTCAPPYPPPVTCPAGTVLQPNGTCAAAAPTCPAGMVLQPDGTCGMPGGVGPVPMTRHTPVAEQLWNHPVPIYLEVNPNLTIGGVFLFYKSPSDVGFQRVEMARSGPGYYVEIPCTMLQPGSWDYYIMVLDPNGNALAQEGSQDRPFHINMLPALSPGALYPTRPDGSTVTDCGPDGSRQPDCPPGLPNCAGVACERSCTFNDDCLASETCLAGCCKPREGDGDGNGDGGMGDRIGLFLNLSIGAGFGLVKGEALEPKWYRADSDGDGVPDSSWYGPDDFDAWVFDGTNGPGGAERQRVPIAAGFALSGGSVRLGMGYFFIPELSLSLNARISFPFGDDFPWLIEGRLHYWFLSGPNHLFGAFAGGGAGLMVHAITKVDFRQDGTPSDPALTMCPNQPVTELPACKTYEPFYKVSGYGAIAVGATYNYMITELFGLGGELAMDIMVPEFSFNFDVLANLVLSF